MLRFSSLDRLLTACHHLVSEVAQFLETQVTKRNVSFFGTVGQQGGNHRQGGATAPSTGVHADDGSIFTGYYPTSIAYLKMRSGAFMRNANTRGLRKERRASTFHVM